MPQYKFDLEKGLGGLSAGQQAKALALIEEFGLQRLANPLEVFVPYRQQHDLLQAIARIRAFFGGNRAGKTTVGVVDDLIEVTPNELLPGHLLQYKAEGVDCGTYGPRYLRCVAPSNKLLRSVFIEKFREWTPKPLLRGGLFGNAYEKYDNVLRLECGCRIDFLSYEMDLDKFGGTAMHKVHYDEEPPEDIREECRARLTDFGGTELFTMTPLLGMTWMYDGIWHRAEKDPNVFVVTASLLDNPYLDPEGVKATVAEYAGNEDMIAARIHGRMVHFGGLVYPAWREWIGDDPPADFVRSCDLVVGIDPGVNGFGLVAVAFDAFNNAIVFWARKLMNADVSHATAEIRSMLGEWQIPEKDVQFVIDPAARQRSAISSSTIETEFINQGMAVNHGQHEREAGVMMIRRRGANGQLSIGRGAGDLLWELERYRKQEREDGKFDVVKKDDHCADAFRYAIMERPYDESPQVMPRRPDPDVCHGPPKRIGRRRESVMGWGA